MDEDSADSSQPWDDRFIQWLRQHKPLIQEVVRMVVEDESARGDILHDSIMALAETEVWQWDEARIRRLLERRPAEVSLAYNPILQVVRHLWDECRREDRTQWFGEIEQDNTPDDRVTLPGEVVDHRDTSAEALRSQLVETLSQFSQDDRELWLLRHTLLGFSNEEIARIRGDNFNNVSQEFGRVKEELEARLTRTTT
jgi:DNA-directed RNA polymerase specialized sigma24 family protein